MKAWKRIFVLFSASVTHNTEDVEWQQITVAANAANSTPYSYRDEQNTLNVMLQYSDLGFGH